MSKLIKLNNKDITDLTIDEIQQNADNKNGKANWK